MVRTTSFSVIAPAKLNLFLHINGRRADGYHELETLFTFLNFGDELSFELTSTPTILVTGDTCLLYTSPSPRD